MTIAKYVSWKNYAGFVVKATPALPVQSGHAPLHLHRAVWLASQLEGAAWGTVQSYDGVAMSGGLLHNIAIDRHGNQGSLFPLIRDIQTQIYTPVVEALEMNHRWVITPDGKLRDRYGRLVLSQTIQEAFTGPKGLTPKSGDQHERAKTWALLFHETLRHSASFPAQVDYAAKWLAQGNSKAEMEVYQFYAQGPVIGKDLDSMIGVSSEQLPPEIDLAMCVYHAFSVNAPAIAQRVLFDVWQKRGSKAPVPFAQALIRALGKRKFGKWADEPGDKQNRYDRTRKALLAKNTQGWWGSPLIDDLMPRDL